MEGPYEYGLTNGSLMDPCVTILKVLSSPRRTIAVSTLFGQTRSGLLNLLIFPSPPKSGTLFKALRWPELLASLTLFYGPTTRARVPSNRRLNSFLTAISSLGTKPFGIGSGYPLVPKRSKFFYGRLCGTVSPPKHTSPLAGLIWIPAAPDAKHQKQPFTFSGTALRLKRYGTNPQVSCPYLSSSCHFKTS